MNMTTHSAPNPSESGTRQLDQDPPSQRSPGRCNQPARPSRLIGFITWAATTIVVSLAWMMLCLLLTGQVRLA